MRFFRLTAKPVDPGPLDFSPGLVTLPENMNGITSLSPSQLRRAADLLERILALQDDLNQILGAPAPGPAVEKHKRTKLSPQGLANIRAEVRKRMQAKAVKASAKPSQRPKRRMSAAAKAKLSAMAKARWRKARAAGKNAL